MGDISQYKNLITNHNTKIKNTKDNNYNDKMISYLHICNL